MSASDPSLEFSQNSSASDSPLEFSQISSASDPPLEFAQNSSASTIFNECCSQSINNSFLNFSTSTIFNINAEEAQLPLILNGKYFKIVKAISDTKHQKDANGVVAACQVCPNNKSLRGSLKVTSNFLNHLKERHRPQYDEFLLEKDQQAKRARKVNSNVDEEEDESDSEEDLPQSVDPPIIRLPKHYRCASHTLNLVATTDYLNIIKSDSKMQEMHMKALKRCSALWNKYFFEISPNCHDAFVAAISCPAIKLKFAAAMLETAPKWTEEKFKKLFVQHAEKFTVNIPPSTSSARKDAKLFSFFDFGESAAEKSVEETPVRVELSHYINDLDESMESLNRYHTIKSAFFLYNTPLPSSAPVERLFSYAGMGLHAADLERWSTTF
ncbi:hypothetical protein ACLKA7_000984 [Drosophila subpalustris]